MVHHRRRPGYKAPSVAGITLGNCRDVIDRLAQCIGKGIAAAMAGRALSGSAGMVHPCRFEGREIGMTGFALSRRWDMVGWLAQCGCTIVTTGTLTVSACVVRINSSCPGNS